MNLEQALIESLETSLADIRARQRQARLRLEELEREEDQTLLALKQIKQGSYDKKEGV